MWKQVVILFFISCLMIFPILIVAAILSAGDPLMGRSLANLTGFVFYLFIRWYYGKNGNDLYEKKLVKRGYQGFWQIEAPNKDYALYRLRHPQWMPIKAW